ncbi:hypothetical protein [Longitalea luteola]|uniref:hypothetical protein n=1 Tax=Longitalea luteola TaxID=2812563 RepID=UPI001A95C0CB|nr:hypothetical protein [Longitalea luteola]
MNNKLVLYGLPVLVLLVIFFPLFQVNYAYLDDFHQLWFNEKGATYNIWFIHGRVLGGLLMDKAFTSINTIDAVKLYRIFSVLGWALAICVYVSVAIQWARYKLIDSRLVLVSAVYLACSLSVAIANGWGGTCFEICLTFMAGLLSGHLLYAQLKKHHRFLAIPIPMQLLVLLLGVTSLFTYQIGIGMFLIPFFLHFNSRRFERPDHILLTGIISFLTIIAIYYLLYKFHLKMEGIEEPERANLTFNILKKISFFVGVPTAQAFSFNFLFNLHSIISQLFYILAIAVWVLHAFLTQRKKPVINKIIYIAGTFALLMLIYLPVMATVENYSSYRSMLALNLAVMLMLTNMIIEWIKNSSGKNGFAIGAMILFAGVGFYNFRYNFLQPVLKEYQVVRTYIEKHYTPGIAKVYFLRPPERLYKDHYGIHYYRDEFGVPLTFKDWVPVPFVKQVIYEITHDKSIAQKTEVVMFNYDDATSFNKQVALKEANTMAIDVPALFESERQVD